MSSLTHYLPPGKDRNNSAGVPWDAIADILAAIKLPTSGTPAAEVMRRRGQLSREQYATLATPQTGLYDALQAFARMSFARMTLADGEQWIDGQVESQSRLIAHLTRERDEAREALANASIIEGHLEQQLNIKAQLTIDELTAKIAELEERINSGDCCAKVFNETIGENDRLKASKETLATALRAIEQENLSLIDQLISVNTNRDANTNPVTLQQPHEQYKNGLHGVQRGVQSVIPADYYGHIHGSESAHTKKLIFLQRCIGSRDYIILQLLDLINVPAPAMRKIQQLMAALDASIEYHEQKTKDKRASAHQQQPSVASVYGGHGTSHINGQFSTHSGYNRAETLGYITHSPTDGSDGALSPGSTPANLKKKLEDVQTREQMLVLRLKEVEEENSLLKGQKKDPNTENGSIQQAVAGDYTTYTDVDAGVQTLEQSVSDLSYTGVEAQYKSLTRDQLLNTVVSMTEDMEERDDTISWLKDYVISTKDNLTAANNRVQKLLQSVHKLVVRDGEAQARLKQFELQANQAEEAFTFRDNELQGFLKYCYAKIHMLEENLNEEKHDMLEREELKNDLEAQLSEVVDFAAEIGWEVTQMIGGLEAESRDAKAQLASREAELSQAKEDIDAHAFDKEKLKKEAHEAIDYQNAEMEKLKVAMVELKVVAADAQETAQKLQTELTVLRNSQRRQSSFSSVTMSRRSSQFGADDARSPFKQGYFHERTMSRRTSALSGRGDFVCVKSPDSVRSFIPSPPSGTLKRLSSVRGQRRGSRYAGMMSPEDAQNVSIPLLKRRFPEAKTPHINLSDATFGNFDLPAEPVTPKPQRVALVSLCRGARDLSIFTDSLSPNKDAANTTFAELEFTSSPPVFSAADGSVVCEFTNSETPPPPQRANPAAQRHFIRGASVRTADALPKGYYAQNLPAVTAHGTFRQGPIMDGILHSGTCKPLTRISNNQVQSRSPLILQPRAKLEVSVSSLISQSADSKRSVSEKTSRKGSESHKSSPASDITVRAESRRAFSSELPLPKMGSEFTSIATRKTRLGLPAPSIPEATMGRHGGEASAASEPVSKYATARSPSTESPDINTSALAQPVTSSGPKAELFGGKGGDLSAQPNQEPQDKISSDTLPFQPVATPVSDGVFTPRGPTIPHASYRAAPHSQKISKTVFKEGSPETPKSATCNAPSSAHAPSAPTALLLPTLRSITPGTELTNGAKPSSAKMDSGDPDFVFPRIPNTKQHRDSVSRSSPIASSTPSRSRQHLPTSPRLSLFPPAPSDNGASQHQKLMSGFQSKSKTGSIRLKKTVNTQSSLLGHPTQFSFGDGSKPKAIRGGQMPVRDIFDEDTLELAAGLPPPIPRKSSKRTATQPLRGRAPQGQRNLVNASKVAKSLHIPPLQPDPATTRFGPASNHVASELATSELPRSRTIGPAPLRAPEQPIPAPKNVPEATNKVLTTTKARGRKVSELASRFSNMQAQSSSPHSSCIEGQGSPNPSMIRLPSSTDTVRKVSSQYSMRVSSLNNSLRSAASNNSMRNVSGLSANICQGNVFGISSNIPQTQSTLRNISASFKGADDGSMYVRKQRQAVQRLSASGGDGSCDSSSFVGADTGSLFVPKERQDIGASQSAYTTVKIEIRQMSSEFESADSGNFFTPGKQSLNQGNLRNRSQASAVSWASELSGDVYFGNPYGPLGIIDNSPEKAITGSNSRQADDQGSFRHFTAEHSSSPASAIKSPSSSHRFASNPFKGLIRPKAQNKQIPGMNTVEGSPRQGSFARNVAAIFMPGFRASPSRSEIPKSPDQQSTPKSRMDKGKSPASDHATPMQRLLVPPQVMKTSPTPQHFFTPTKDASDENTPTKAGVMFGIRDKDGNLVNQTNLKPPQLIRRRRSSTASRADSGTGASSHPSIKSPKLPHAHHENEALRDIEGRIISSRFPPPVGYKSPPPRHNFPGLPAPLQESTESQLRKAKSQAGIHGHSGNYSDLESPRGQTITNEIGDNIRRYGSPFAPAVPSMPEISGSPTPTDEYEPSFLHVSDRGSFDDADMREAIVKAKIQCKLEALGAALAYSMTGSASQMFSHDDTERARDATEVPLPRNMSEFSYLSYMTRTTATSEMDPVRAAKARKEAEDRLNGAGPADDSYSQDKGIAFLEKLFEKGGKDDPALMMLSPKSRQMQQIQEHEYTTSDYDSGSGSRLGAVQPYARKGKGTAQEYSDREDSANTNVFKQQDQFTSSYDFRSGLSAAPSYAKEMGKSSAHEYFGREDSANTEVFNFLGAEKAREKAMLMGEIHRHIKQEPINRAMAASIEEENIKIRAMEDARFAKMAKDEEERIARIIEAERRKAEFDQRQQEYATNMQREVERREERGKVETEEKQKEKNKKKGGAFKRLFSR